MGPSIAFTIALSAVVLPHPMPIVYVADPPSYRTLIVSINLGSQIETYNPQQSK